MASFRKGHSARVKVSNTTLAKNEYTVNHRGEDIETTNFESEGKEEGLVGIEALDWTLKGHWNAAQNPIDDPPGLYPREDGDEMYLYTNVTDDKYYNMPLFRCINSNIRVTVKGALEFDAGGKSQGAFTTPSGSV